MDQTYSNPYALTAAEAAAEERAIFIRRTYLHLAGALLAFAGCLAAIQVIPVGNSTLALELTGWIFSIPFGWLLVLGGFMAVGYVADSWARSGATAAAQYGGLGLYIVAESIIFTPLMTYAAYQSGPDMIFFAGILTLLLFAGLTVVAFTSGVNFTFLGGALRIGSFVALGIIVAGVVFGFTLGLFFAGAMMLFAGGAILYSTSGVMHEYRTDQHVAASLALFAAVALLFYYVLYFLISLAGRD